MPEYFGEKELKLWRILGIVYFRKLVMAVEKWLHRNDKCYNSNYHIKGYSCEALVKFYPFLCYNAFVHLLSNFFVIIYIIFRVLGFGGVVCIDIAAFFIFILNTYCIILQRYNYLMIYCLKEKYEKIRKRKWLLMKKRAERYVSVQYSPEYKKTDLAFLYRMDHALCTGENFFIEKKDIGTLERFSEMVNPPIMNKPLFVNKIEERVIKDILSDVCHKKMVYTKTEKRVDLLQKKFHQKSSLLDIQKVIFTEDDTEKVYMRSLGERIFHCPKEAVSFFLYVLEN